MSFPFLNHILHFLTNFHFNRVLQMVQTPHFLLKGVSIWHTWPIHWILVNPTRNAQFSFNCQMLLFGRSNLYLAVFPAKSPSHLPVPSSARWPKVLARTSISTCSKSSWSKLSLRTLVKLQKIKLSLLKFNFLIRSSQERVWSLNSFHIFQR